MVDPEMYVLLVHMNYWWAINLKVFSLCFHYILWIYGQRRHAQDIKKTFKKIVLEEELSEYVGIVWSEEGYGETAHNIDD